jgi:NTP pyrophosphatase (non-canonical NTP hydrolase)
MGSDKNIIEELTGEIRAFAQARDWEQYHTPKNLTMALAGEAGELVAELQWLTPAEASPDALTMEQREALMLEMADVQIYLLRLADVLGIDVADAVRKKLAINETRF